MASVASPDPRQERVFKETVDRFNRDCLADDALKEEFQLTGLGDLQAAIGKLQDRQAGERKMRNMNRLKSFLEGMEQFGKVIEVFLNASSFLAFVWVSDPSSSNASSNDALFNDASSSDLNY